MVYGQNAYINDRGDFTTLHIDAGEDDIAVLTFYGSVARYVLHNPNLDMLRKLKEAVDAEVKRKEAIVEKYGREGENMGQEALDMVDRATGKEKGST